MSSNSTGRDDEECSFGFTTARRPDIFRKWFLDSGASRHISNQHKAMFDYRNLEQNEFVNAAAEGSALKVVGVGYIRVSQVIDGTKVIFVLKDVGYAPKCRTNLVALSKAQRAGIEIKFIGGGTKMRATINGRPLIEGDSEATGITELTGLKPVPEGKPDVIFFNAGGDDAMELAHRRMCHTAVGTLKKMEDNGAVTGLDAVWSIKKIACAENDKR